MRESSAPQAGKQEASSPARGLQLAALAFGLVLAALLLELALRIVPQSISPKLLILFEPGIRAHIAAGAYPLQKDFRQIARDDGGPPLFVARPQTRIVSIDEVPDHAVRYTDEIGFCNPPGRWNAHDRIDLLALGDSFTWCHAVVPQDAWPALLGDREGISVFSLGRGGNGLYEYLQFLREFGLARHPRLVVMNVYGGNDLRDAEKVAAYREAVARGVEPPSEIPHHVAPDLLASAIGRHSYALNLVLAFASQLANAGANGWERAGIDFHYELLLASGPLAFNIQNRDRDEIVAARSLRDGRSSLALWDEPLQRLAALARTQGFTGVVSYTPSAHVAYADRVRFADPSIAGDLATLDDAQRAFLAERCEALGLVFHDLTPDLRAASQGDDASSLLYDPVHLHLTARGNRVLAGALASFLETSGLRAKLD